MNTHCPVLTRFLDSWNTYLSDTERNLITRPLAPRMKQATNTSDAQTARRRMTLDWHLRTALPAWLDLAGLTAPANTLREFSQDIFGQGEEHQQALDLFDSVNTLLTDSVNSLDSTCPYSISQTLRAAANVAVGASGERPALLSAARPYIDYRPWMLFNCASNTAPYAAILTALRAHEQDPSADPALIAATAFAHPSIKGLRDSAAQLFTNMAHSHSPGPSLIYQPTPDPTSKQS